MVFVVAVLALLPLAFLALSVRGQTPGHYVVVNTATGLVFEDYNPVPFGFGNPIVGAPYDLSNPVTQSWSLVQTPDSAVGFMNPRPAIRQAVFIGTDAFRPWPRLQTRNVSTGFNFERPFGTDNGIFAFVVESLGPLAITAPSVENGTLTLRPYNPTDLYQHWIFLAPGGSSTATSGDGIAAGVTVANPIVGTDEKSPKL